MTTPLRHFHLFTDGACSGNPGPGGWAYILRDLSDNTEFEESGGDPSTTNNRMELMAVISGLEFLIEPCMVDIYADSQYVLKGLTEWLDGWIRRNWTRGKNKPVLNRDLWERLVALREHHTITCHWIRGHDDHPENERCDRLAVQAIPRK